MDRGTRKKPWKWRNSARLGWKVTEQSANLRVFVNWKTWWPTRFRTQILPGRVGDVSGMWDQRLVRLALLQQLRAVYGIKIKGSRSHCDRRRRETATTETVVSFGEGDLPGHAKMFVLYGSERECDCVSNATQMVNCWNLKKDVFLLFTGIFGH